MDALPHGQAGKKAAFLKRANQPQARDLMWLSTSDPLASECHRAFGWRHEAADRVEQCRLAGPVWADDTHDFVVAHGEGGVVHRSEPAEPDRQFSYIEHAVSFKSVRASVPVPERSGPRQLALQARSRPSPETRPVELL